MGFPRGWSSGLPPSPGPEHIFTDLLEDNRGAHMTWVQVRIQAKNVGQLHASHLCLHGTTHGLVVTETEWLICRAGEVLGK